MRRRASWLPLVAALLAVSGLAEPHSSAAGRASDAVTQVVARLHYRDQQHLDAVAGRLDIWEVHRSERYVLASVQPAQLQWLRELGYEVHVDMEHTERLRARASLDPRFYFYDSYNPNSSGRYLVSWLQDTTATHAELTELIDVGDAWQAGQGGHHRDMWVLRVTNEDTAFGPIEDKPVFFLMASIHAREVATNELAMRYVSYLLGGWNGEGGYGFDPDVTWLVDHNALYVMVMQNPDGRVPNEQSTDYYWRKNVDSDDGCTDPDSWGVDLNRNHSFLWGCCDGSSGSPCDETYRGPSAASEPETAAFEAFFSQAVPDQNGDNDDSEFPVAAPEDAQGIFISLHSYADEILWSWYLPGYGDAPNQAQMQVIGRKLAFFNGFEPSGTIGYTVDGASDYWTYGKFGIPSFTFEVGSGDVCGGFFPAYGCIDGIDGMPRSFWAENRPAFLYAHKIAGAPYIQSKGPDARDVSASPAGAAPGHPVELTATIADLRYSGDSRTSIAAAEYFLDAPGADGTGIPMSPSDGSFGGLSEGVVATIDTSGLSAGRHYILVHGQGTNHYWGPYTASFAYVLQAGVSPTIQGFVRDAGNNAPLAADIKAGAFHADTDPETGFYNLIVAAGSYDMTAESGGYVVSSTQHVVAENGQALVVSFYLYRSCDLFRDDVESGSRGWTADAPWATTDEASHSAGHSWTDSPGAVYGNNLDVSLTSPVLDLSGTTGAALHFWHIYDLQYRWDYGYVEYSIDEGTSWTTAASYSQDAQLTWTQANLTLPALDNQARARIRFRLKTTPYVQQDGWHLDDIVLSGGGPVCVTAIAPVPEFSSNSPVVLGTEAAFTNRTIGTPPMEYAWDFGDGAGTSTQTNPRYVYALPGTYEVTLTATNGVGSGGVFHHVEVVGRRIHIPLVTQGP